jgi:histidyl-tRNA synthetase
MANIIKAPRGTADLTPEQTRVWRYAESVIRGCAARFGFGEIRFPTFEYTELFSRGVGETTDVVQKEMYTFEDRGGRSVTLRPEGTAPTVRAVLQNGLHNGPMPLRLYYLVSCFRGERPQAGRLREFHQFGAELFGAAGAAADAELIALAAGVFEKLGIEGLELRLNSIGCPECRGAYHDALRQYFESKKGELCPTCLGRLERNPMRILDCKEDGCKKAAAGAPRMLDYLCDDCRAHFGEVRERLEALGYGYTIDTSIVRGLDYYTRTVFEFVDAESGLTVCGGGRYDGLVAQLGGPQLPALGFGMGLERLVMTMEKRGVPLPEDDTHGIFIASVGGEASRRAAELAFALRALGIPAQYELSARSVKAQMKYADKLNFGYTLVVGDDELRKNQAALRRMSDGKAAQVPLDGGFARACADFAGL